MPLLPSKEANAIRRERILRREGFLPFELRVLRFIPLKKTPYMKDVRKMRKDIRRQAWQGRWSLAKYRGFITDIYKANEWYRRGKDGKLRVAPQEMLDNFKREYQGKHPDYTSPSEKKPRVIKADFIEQQLKYPRGRAYGTK